LIDGMTNAHLERVAFPNMYHHSASMPVSAQAQSRNTLAYQSFPPDYQQTQQMPPQLIRQNVPAQYVPYVPPRMPIVPTPANVPAIQIADIAHLRGTNWSNAMTQRARETVAKLSRSGKAARILHLHETRYYPDPYLQMSPPKRQAVPTRQLSSPAAPVFGTDVSFQPNMTPQPQTSMQQIEIPAPGAVGIGRQFANHPGFYNVRSAFPSTQHGGLMEATKSLTEQDVTSLHFGVDSKRQ
jgi:hypothetical protein